MSLIQGQTHLVEIEGKHFMICPSKNEYGDTFWFVGQVFDRHGHELIKSYAEAYAMAKQLAEADR